MQDTFKYLIWLHISPFCANWRLQSQRGCW